MEAYMKLTLLKFKNVPISVLESIRTPISTVQDALDLITDANYQGTQNIIIKREHLHKDFFDIQTNLANDIMKKIVNNYKYLVVVGDYSDLKKRSWLDFMTESNRVGRIMFVEDTQTAVKRLTKV